MFRLSPCGFEARNYQLLADAGIPMAKLVAVGDTRKMFLLKNMFLITEFAENFRDGRDFQPDGCLHDNAALKEEYIVRNLQLLARCHDAGLIHGGFTPANLLYSLRETPDEYGNKLDLIWIDVATCRKISPVCPAARMAGDFNHFFRFLDIGNEERKRYLQIYNQSITRRRLPFEKLLKLCTVPGKKK
jgi:tRNA A-37 threonylcarbamoyl transferase component Bud32